MPRATLLIGVLLGLGCIGWLASPALAQSGAVTGLDLAANGQWTDLTIHTQGEVSPTNFRLDRPARVVVDVRGAAHALPRADFTDLSRGAVQNIRTSQFDATTVRIVVDLERAARHRVAVGPGWIRLSLRGSVDFEPWAVGSAEVDASVPTAPSGAQMAGPSGVSARPIEFGVATNEAASPDLGAATSIQTEVTPSTAPVSTSPFPSAETVAAQRATLEAMRASERTVEPAAQPDTIVLVALITQLAGATVYIDQGVEAGLMEGDTVALLSSPVDAALFEVVSSSATRAVLTFIGSPVPLTRGDRIRLEPRSRATTLADDNPLTPADPVAMGEATVDDSTRPNISGRIFLDLNALQSTTMWEGATVGQSRTFLTPTTRVSASATDLPGGLRVELNARGSYRHTSGGQVPSSTSIRFYDFSATKVFEGSRPVRVQFGRFYNPYESFSGYWDGGMFRVGGENGGIGAAAGYRPNYSNEGFSTDLPKVTVFADLRRVTEEGGFTSDVSFHRVTPLQNLDTHTFLGWASRAWWNKFQWSHEVQVDRVAETGEWILTEFQAYASTALRDRIRVYGRYSRRQPFDFWDPESQLAYRRDGLGGGLNMSWNTGSASADVGVRDSDERPRTTTYSGSLRLSSVARSRLGFSAWGSYWSDENTHGISFSPAFTRPFGRSYGRLGYRYYSSQSVFHTLDTHALVGSLTAPIGPGLRLSLQGQASWGGNLQSFGLYTGFWKSF